MRYKLHIAQQMGVNWICQRMAGEILDSAPEHVEVSISAAYQDEPDTLIYFNPYRTMGEPTRLCHARSVAFCTHPEKHELFWSMPDLTDHVIVMAEQHRQGFIDRGHDENKITLLYPGIDAAYRDTRLRVFLPVLMTGRKRKGVSLYERLRNVPWLNVICSNGEFSAEQMLLEYRAADVILSTAIPDNGGEGGPMLVREGLALGKYVVAPAGIGHVDDHANMMHGSLYRYPAGDYEALLQVLSAHHQRQLSQRRMLQDASWSGWAAEMWRIFEGVMT
jgi:hypothetical protein